MNYSWRTEEDNFKMEVDELFENAMKGRWDEVVGAVEKNPRAQEIKLTRSESTALHVAVLDGQTDIVLQLVERTGENASKILNMKNNKGNTALHLAAELGNVKICYCMASKHPELVSVHNNAGETPLFMAALQGKKEAFLCLHYLSQEAGKDIEYSSCRRSNGDTILHVAISGEFFSLAFQIIQLYPDLVNSVNEDGLSPLHILASEPNAFKSGSRLGLFDRIIYRSIIVDDELSWETHDWGAYLNSSQASTSPNYPENYRSCVNLFRLIRPSLSLAYLLPSKHESSRCNRSDEEQAKNRGIISESIRLPKKEDEDHLFPPNYATIVRFFRLMMKLLLIVLGVGIWRIKKVSEKKRRHRWATMVRDELVLGVSLHKYDHHGRNPQNLRSIQDDETVVPTALPSSDNLGRPLREDTNLGMNSTTTTKNNYQSGENQHVPGERDTCKQPVAKMRVIETDRLPQSSPAASEESKTLQNNIECTESAKKERNELGKKETPILIAAKMGVLEMVEKILDTFPVAIQDQDSDGKNVMLLAVENRQTYIYQFLLNRRLVRESVFRQLDNEGNSALHLAATYGDYRPWLIPGAALQMQWEIKWYEFVKKSMPAHFFPRYNKQGRTPREIFTTTHKELIKEGSEWLTKTCESCSVVAALIATVAFATSATVPGGVRQEDGKPTLEREPAFNVFAMSSLVALCSSLTALVFFLSILTSRFQERDFAKDLPTKLLIGLASLFTSITSVLVSFCSGHFFELRDEVRYATYPIYGATCLPVTFFALAQLPLYFDLTWAIFTKVPQRSYKVFRH
ncbi:hypothetical protein SLA2020_256780 [Shorea laevis]